MLHAQRVPDIRAPEVERDPDILGAYLEDASSSPAGRAAGLVRPASEAEAAAFLRENRDPVLIQAARSSLTGGAVPRGEIVLSVERMRERGAIESSADAGRATVQPGMRLDALLAELAEKGYYYAPVPTYQQAMLGGTVATNAGGAASFKYGVTRQWVQGLRVLLFNGDLLMLERGQQVVRRGGTFRIGLSDGTELEVPVPEYRLPDLKKISAGYHAADPLDLVDLFVGSEGTLGLITAITVKLVPLPAATATGLVFLDDANLALLLAAALRDAALKAREQDDPAGPDVRAIEWLDESSLRILRERGDARRLRIDVPASARAGLLFELELPEPTTDDQVEGVLADFLERQADPADGPLVRLFRILEDHRAMEHLDLAFPEKASRRRALNDLREAVPTGIGEMLSERRRTDPEVKKIGGDLIVPVSELPAMIEAYRAGFERRGLQFAIWGHLSDGNLHPNALPRNADEVRAGFEALIEFADEAARRGGCPLSEHGVGRNPIKQEILRRFLGNEAIATMRRIKAALDPQGRFAPGVLFPA
jgi:D-lactate dehydrogenase (cytochrome)